MRFEWDIYKAISNVAKHDVGFQQAVTVFDDVCPLIVQHLARSSADEVRYHIIGEVDPSFATKNCRILAVVYTIRDEGDIYRLISARPASRAERRAYETQKRSRESTI